MLRRRLVADEGFSLIETVVAMFLAALMFVVVGATIGASLARARLVRIEQQATATATAYVEEVHAIDWADVEMASDPDPADPRVDAVNGTLKTTDLGLSSDEDLVIDTVNGLVDYTLSETVDGQAFTITQYVTDAGTNLRRVVVFVDWNDPNGRSRSVHLTTLLANDP